MSMVKDRALEVTCPRCGAAPGQKCIDTRTGRPAPGGLVHAARPAAWKQQQGRQDD